MHIKVQSRLSLWHKTMFIVVRKVMLSHATTCRMRPLHACEKVTTTTTHMRNDIGIHGQRDLFLLFIYTHIAIHSNRFTLLPAKRKMQRGNCLISTFDVDL